MTEVVDGFATSIGAWSPLLNFFVIFFLGGFLSISLLPDEVTGWYALRSFIKYGGYSGAAGIILLKKVGMEITIGIAAGIGVALINKDKILQLISPWLDRGTNGPGKKNQPGDEA